MAWFWPFSRKRASERVEPDFRASIENPNVPITSDELSFIISGGPTMAGPTVSESTSIRCVEVFRCASLLSGMIASLRMNVYRTVDGRRELAANNRLYPLLRSQPNDFMSAYSWKELMVVNVLLWGNHYSRIEYDNAGRVIGFVPLPPWDTKPERKPNGDLIYTVRTSTGEEVYDQEDILHVPGVGFDGIRGLSVISAVGRQAIGTSLAMEEFTARLHSNGVRPSGIGKVKEGISPAAFNRMRQQFENHYAGAVNAGTTLWMDAGTEWQPMQLSPHDAETLASRRFSTAQICNIFGVPAMLLNENADMTAWGSGIEQIMIGFLMTTLNPHLERIEGELNRKLFLGTNFEVEFDREGLIVLDSKSKAELFSKLVNSALMTPNEGRRKINLPDHPNGGDDLYIQGGMVPLEKAGEQIAPADAPTASAGAGGAPPMDAQALGVRDSNPGGQQHVSDTSLGGVETPFLASHEDVEGDTGEDC